MSLPKNGFSDEEINAKRTDAIVKLRIRENDVKSQIWKLMSDNSFEVVTAAEGEVSKIFRDLDKMIIGLFDIMEANTRSEEDIIEPNKTTGKPSTIEIELPTN